jgi:hypothetical protein
MLLGSGGTCWAEPGINYMKRKGQVQIMANISIKIVLLKDSFLNEQSRYLPLINVGNKLDMQKRSCVKKIARVLFLFRKQRALFHRHKNKWLMAIKV